jgi:hypothetical protein
VRSLMQDMRLSYRRRCGMLCRISLTGILRSSIAPADMTTCSGDCYSALTVEGASDIARKLTTQNSRAASRKACHTAVICSGIFRKCMSGSGAISATPPSFTVPSPAP